MNNDNKHKNFQKKKSVSLSYDLVCANCDYSGNVRIVDGSLFFDPSLELLKKHRKYNPDSTITLMTTALEKDVLIFQVCLLSRNGFEQLN